MKRRRGPWWLEGEEGREEIFRGFGMAPFVGEAKEHTPGPTAPPKSRAVTRIRKCPLLCVVDGSSQTCFVFLFVLLRLDARTE